MRLKIRNLTKHELIDLVDRHETYTSIIKELGFCETGGAIRDLKFKIKELGIDSSKIDNNWRKYVSSSSFKTVSYEDLLVKDSTRRINSNYKKRMIRDGLLKNECYKCELGPEWNDEPLVLQIEHKNGDHYDNRLENLELLCPNCHSQTKTHSVAKNTPTKPLNKCIDCGDAIRHGSERCSRCAIKPRSEKRVIFKISKDELIKLRKTKSYRQISFDYGVSDKTVKKWCIKYGID